MLLRSHDGDLRRVAVAYNFNTDVLELPGLDDRATVEYMDSFDDCLAALHSGEIDAYYTYTYQAERTVFDDKRTSCGRCSATSGAVLHRRRPRLRRAAAQCAEQERKQPDPRRGRLHHQQIYQPGHAEILAGALGVPVSAGHCADLPVRCRRDRLHQAGAAQPPFPRRGREGPAQGRGSQCCQDGILSNMSHDIRTPINGIMGMLDIAEEI